MPLVHSVREKKRSAHYYSKNKPATPAEVVSAALAKADAMRTSLEPVAHPRDKHSVFCHLTGGGRRVARVAGSNTRGIYHPPNYRNAVDYGRVKTLSLDEFYKKHGC